MRKLNLLLRSRWNIQFTCPWGLFSQNSRLKATVRRRGFNDREKSFGQPRPHNDGFGLYEN